MTKMAVKSFLKSRFPRAVAVYRDARQVWSPSLTRVFSEIYHTNAWQDPESVSGRGSTLARTGVIMSHLPLLIQELNAKTLLDAACGDLNWMRHVELGSVRYIGIDVVPDLISRNRELYEDQHRTFVVLDITQDPLPNADVILCRDCLIHLSFRHIAATIANFKKTTATHLLCTTHTTITENIDCPDGSWRNVNLALPPFNFPEPFRLIVEDAESGKGLGVWRLEDL
jgi:2-polyprenyl-3-methyl-5-hydroxy-6-metoxy-1,4-benzoquinol methylase